MSSLTIQQKQLLLDYCIGLTSPKEAAEAERLIAASKEAAEIFARIKASLAPLETLKSEPCPHELVEGTIWRANNFARSSRQLQQLLATEQARDVTTKKRLCWGLGKTVAAAAVILIVLGTWFAPLDFMRHKYRQHLCKAQLARVFQGLSSYTSEHDGRMPAVATTPGSPWWKVGYQGKENHSATRNMWLLVKGNYVNPADFVCPGKSRDLIIRLDPALVQSFNDFPARRYVTYSVRIKCSKSAGSRPAKRKALMADLSPLFENLPDDFSKPFKLTLDEE
ncbi:MAG: hypothetical protein ACYS76_14875, partial [Planctomycetota bacterium]